MCVILSFSKHLKFALKIGESEVQAILRLIGAQLVADNEDKTNMICDKGA